MTEDDLRAAFARHEHLTPAAGPLVQRIQEGYRRRMRRRITLRVTGATLAAVVLVTTPAAMIGMAGTHTRPRPAATETGPPPTLRPGPLNFLLVGVDRRPGQSDNLARADTVMLIHVSAMHDRAYLVSIPGDTLVDIPASGSFRGQRDKINLAYSAGGAGLLRRTIESNFGVVVDGGVVVDFAGLLRVVDSIGGLDLYVDERTVSVHIGRTSDGQYRAPYTFDGAGRPKPVPGVTPQTYQVGYHHLAGWEVLDFVRQRELIADGDTGRERHVRQVLAALVRKVHSDGVLADPGRAPAFLDSVARAVTMDSGMLPVLAVARTLDGIDSAHLAGLQVPTVAAPVPTGLTLSQSGRDLMAALAHDDLDDWIAAHRGAVTPA